MLILSADAVGAALLGALIETLGYAVRFGQPSEPPEESLRRVRPQVCLVDAVDPNACSPELLGRSRMRGIGVVIFGRSEALERIRALAVEHDLDTLVMPPAPGVLEATLQRAQPTAG